MKKIQDFNPTKEELLNLKYNYQSELTEKLDNLNSDFNQDIINEIVLWKLNRYAKLSSGTIDRINEINGDSSLIDQDSTKVILRLLLNSKGIRLPMASTVLRFKNPNVYQIIDQRVYRLIYGEKLKLKSNIEESINQYLNYLAELKEVCTSYNIPFHQSDRILYLFDKENNIENIDY